MRKVIKKISTTIEEFFFRPYKKRQNMAVSSSNLSKPYNVFCFINWIPIV